MDENVLKPIANKGPTYRRRVYSTIKDAILSGLIGVEKPLVEEQLAAWLNISRTPVREALAILEHEGLIVPRGSRGLYVRQLSRAEFVELFMANEMIEPSLARRAAFLSSEEHIRLMEENISRGRHYAREGDFIKFLAAGREFHRLVGEAAENVPLAEFVVRNEERTDVFLIGAGKTSDSQTMLASIREHEAILNAIIKRDPDEAARLVIVHAQAIRERFNDLFGEPQSAVDEDNWGDLNRLVEDQG